MPILVPGREPAAVPDIDIDIPAEPAAAVRYIDTPVSTVVEAHRIGQVVWVAPTFLSKNYSTKGQIRITAAKWVQKQKLTSN